MNPAFFTIDKFKFAVIGGQGDKHYLNDGMIFTMFPDTHFLRVF